MSEVYVVTNPEIGWNCVVGVFNADDVPRKHLEELFPDYIVHRSLDVHKDTYNFLEPDDE